jgi:hypothetical protein
MDKGFESVDSLLSLMFPNGTRPGSRTFSEVPIFPTDLFGAVAFLLERSGAYHRIEPPQDPGSHRVLNSKPSLNIDETTRKQCCELGKRWRKSLEVAYLSAIKVPKVRAAETPSKELADVLQEIDAIWKMLHFGKIPKDLLLHIDDDAKIMPPWCKYAYQLLVIADEAAEGWGYGSGNKRNFFEEFQRSFAGYPIVELPTEWHFLASAQANMATFLDERIARVLPKSRTPNVGCTLRTLSHNLALVPPKGIVEIDWTRDLAERDDGLSPLNLLLIPIPYSVSAQDFRPVGTINAESSKGSKYGWFEIIQSWLFEGSSNKAGAPKLKKSKRKQFVKFVFDLIQKTEADLGKVHGLIFPELALNSECYLALVNALKLDFDNRYKLNKSSLPRVEFLVSGVSENVTSRNSKSGNFAVTTIFAALKGRGLIAQTYSRAKHHRWLLSSQQIADYGLSSALNPNVGWWEASNIPNRQIGLTAFRAESIFTTMICEDLARIDPCHDPLRSIGPNLVFVLLMDGPQLKDRWSARYGTTLADDPGCSVLTLTSLGLIERSNRTNRFPKSKAIAIWKDDSGNTVSIDCPDGHQAVALTISGTSAEEFTLDGRPNSDTLAWRYRGHQPVSVASSIS